jgi:hypothetical protein
MADLEARMATREEERRKDDATRGVLREALADREEQKRESDHYIARLKQQRKDFTDAVQASDSKRGLLSDTDRAVLREMIETEIGQNYT